MRTIVRLVLIGGLAVAGLAVSVTPASAGKPAFSCTHNGLVYPDGWVGVINGVPMRCDHGFWHVLVD